MSNLVDEINSILGESESLDERLTGGRAFSKFSTAWRQRSMDLLGLVTQLRLAVTSIQKTPGYTISKANGSARGPNTRPGLAELESGVKHLTAAIRDIRKGIEKMETTTFLESDQ